MNRAPNVKERPDSRKDAKARRKNRSPDSEPRRHEGHETADSGFFEPQRHEGTKIRGATALTMPVFDVILEESGAFRRKADSGTAGRFPPSHSPRGLRKAAPSQALIPVGA